MEHWFNKFWLTGYFALKQPFECFKFDQTAVWLTRRIKKTGEINLQRLWKFIQNNPKICLEVDTTVKMLDWKFIGLLQQMCHSPLQNCFHSNRLLYKAVASETNAATDQSQLSDHSAESVSCSCYFSTSFPTSILFLYVPCFGYWAEMLWLWVHPVPSRFLCDKISWLLLKPTTLCNNDTHHWHLLLFFFTLSPSITH